MTPGARAPDPPFAGAQAARDRGLDRAIGTPALAASIVNIVVGAGIFTLPAAVALQAGAAAPAAYGLCAVIMAGVTTCFAAAGSRAPTSGGVYGTVEAAFGPAAGFVVGILLILSDLLASGGIAAAVVGLAGTQIPVLAAGTGRFALTAGLYALLAWANLVGVRRTARLIAGATLVKLLPLLLFVLLGVIAIRHPAPSGPPMPPVTLAGFGRALILTLFAFEGMETALGASGEVRHANRALPRALLAAMLFVLVLYLGVQLSAQHLLGGTLAHAPAPLAQAAARFGAPLRAIMLAGAGLSMLAWLASDILGTSRMLFALARDGRLPAWLARLDPHSRIPARAVLAYAAAAALLAATGSFLELVVLSSLATVAIYILACAAALVLDRRGVALAGPPLRLAALPFAAGIGLAGMGFMLAAARWQELAGLAAVLGASLAAHAAMHRHAGRKS